MGTATLSIVGFCVASECRFLEFMKIDSVSYRGLSVAGRGCSGFRFYWNLAVWVQPVVDKKIFKKLLTIQLPTKPVDNSVCKILVTVSNHGFIGVCYDLVKFNTGII